MIGVSAAECGLCGAAFNLRHEYSKKWLVGFSSKFPAPLIYYYWKETTVKSVNGSISVNTLFTPSLHIVSFITRLSTRRMLNF